MQLLSESEMLQLRSILAPKRNIVICCHKSPDGDAVGSSLAWASYLRRTGPEDRKVTVVVPDAAPDFLSWMSGYQDVVRHNKKPEVVKELLDAADLVCCLDFNSLSRTEGMQELLEQCAADRLVIDHHLSPDIDAVMTISHPEKCSTSDMVFNIVCQLGGYEDMPLSEARCIYCGMMTDTGAFTYNSSDPEIFYTIGKLMEKGVDKDEVYKKVYHNYSMSALKLRAYVILRKLKHVKALHACYFTLTKDEMRRYHYAKGDLEGLVNEPLQVKGMKLSISLREDTEKNNLVLVSLRSSNGFHCEEVARRYFNGGGHADAAGGKLYCSIEEAEAVANSAILAFRKELGGV